MNLYGTRETNPLPQGWHDTPYTGHADWTTPGLRITRLRLLSDPGFPYWDVSYCDGVLNGQKVSVSLPFAQLDKTHFWMGQRCARPSLARQIVAHAIRDGVNAKRLGILDCISTLN